MATQLPMGFMLPESSWEVPRSVPPMHRHDTVAVDLETRDDGLKNSVGPGWVHGLGYITGVAVAAGEESFYLPVRHPDTENMDEGAVRDMLERVFRECRVVMHRAVYDLGWLTTQWQLPYPERVDDTMIMEFTLSENELTYNLDDTCRRRGVKGKDERILREAARAHGLDPKSEMWQLPARYVGPYAQQDATSTLELRKVLSPQIEAQGCGEAYRLETDIAPLIVEMRRRGIRIDEDRAPEVRETLCTKRDEYLGVLSDRLQIGRTVEIGDVLSPRFLEKIFQSENLMVPRTAKGNSSFKTEEIEKLDHWLPELVTGARKMHDAGEKFVGNYIMGFTSRGRIHAEIHPTKTESGGARTTRMAYSDPPLQQMPSRNPEIKKLIRGLFLPEEGEVWGALDYSQQEYRLIVHFAYLCKIAGADAAVQRYREDPETDFHNYVAEITRLPRRRAKDCNFGKAFGAGVAKFALMTGMSEDEAREVMGQYDEELPFVKGLADFCSRRAQSRGFIRLLDGARSRYERWEPRWQEGVYHAPMDHRAALEATRTEGHPWFGAKLKRAMTHKSMNSLIQGSAARQTKLCMRAVWREGVVPLLQLHDELDFSFSDPRTAELCEELMRDTVKLEVPVVVDAEFGTNWGNASEDKETGYGATYQEAVKLLGKNCAT
jgi:DNA polymerase I-like protein with 3'-5' exonuclease and polymerase domains